jgi:hypothetical protein
VSERKYVFHPCHQRRHSGCSASYRDSYGSPFTCSCTCHNNSEKSESVSFEIKTSTKVTGVTVELTPEAARETFAAVKAYWVEDAPVHLQWKRVDDALNKAEGE